MPESSFVSSATDTTIEVEIEQAPVPCPPGFTAWRIVGTTGCTVLPSLLTSAPGPILRAYLARVTSILVGTCPLCLQTAWISTDADPETHPVGWRAFEVSVGDHASGCVRSGAA